MQISDKANEKKRDAEGAFLKNVCDISRKSGRTTIINTDFFVNREFI